MKVLVTGAAGFIASHIVDRLIEEGHEVIIVDNLYSGFRKNLNPKAKFYQVDICDEEKIKKIFDKERPKLVNHHAAHNNALKSIEDPVFDAKVNIQGSLNIISNSLRTNVEKIIYASSGGLSYGEPEYIPMDEKHPIRPTSPYGNSKYIVEEYLRMFGNRGLKFTSLRYASVFGPRQNPLGEVGVIAIFIGKLLNKKRPTIFGDGTQTRDFVFIDDVVKANMLAMDQGDNDVFNVGTQKETSVQEIFDAIKELTDSNVAPIYGEERPTDIKRCCLDMTKIKRVMGWSPKYDTKKGLSKTVDYFRGEFKK